MSAKLFRYRLFVRQSGWVEPVQMKVGICLGGAVYVPIKFVAFYIVAFAMDSTTKVTWSPRNNGRTLGQYQFHRRIVQARAPSVPLTIGDQVGPNSGKRLHFHHGVAKESDLAFVIHYEEGPAEPRSLLQGIRVQRLFKSLNLVVNGIPKAQSCGA